MCIRDRIRANLGDTVRIRFFNQLGRRASIHVQGLSNSVLTSDGANVGFNPDTTTDDSICYTWLADKEGAFLFSDLADPRSSEEGANVHGLFGAILVEPAGSVWLHPETGKPLRSGLFADICSPGRPAVREYAVFFLSLIHIYPGHWKHSPGALHCRHHRPRRDLLYWQSHR